MKRSPSKFPFTVSRLQKLPSPDNGRIYHYDNRTAGLPLETARLVVDKLTGDVAMGGDPAAERRVQRQIPTMDEVFSWYMEHYSRPHKKGWRKDQGRYDNHVRQAWGSRKVNTITRLEVQSLHTKIGTESGPVAANRVRSMLHTIFAAAIDRGLIDGDNPAKGVKTYAEKSRDRFLDADEMKRFFMALVKEPNHTVRDFLLLSLLTGARKGNVESMQWKEIDFNRGVWRIPETKTGKPLVVPLSLEALGVLQRRHEDAGESPYVLPALRPATSWILGSPGTVFARKPG